MIKSNKTMYIEDFKFTRKALGLTLRDVSKETGISITTLSRIEKGSNVGSKTVIKLEEFYKGKRDGKE